MIKNYLMIFIGGGLGSMIRFAISSFLGSRSWGLFWIGTLSVNIIGAFLIGLFVELAAMKFSGLNQYKLLLVTGFLGGFTTFSTFSLEVAIMLKRQEFLIMISYITLSLICTIFAVILAMKIVRFFS